MEPTPATKRINRALAIRALETLIQMVRDGDETTVELDEARKAIEVIAQNALN